MTIIVAAIIIATIVIAATLFSAVVPEKLVAAIDDAVVAGKVVLAPIVAAQIVAAKIGVGKMFVMRIAKIGRNRIRLNFALAEAARYVGYGFFFVESDLAGVGAYEPSEDAAGSWRICSVKFRGRAACGC